MGGLVILYITTRLFFIVFGAIHRILLLVHSSNGKKVQKVLGGQLVNYFFFGGVSGEKVAI